MISHGISIGVLLVVLVAAAVCDLKTGKVYNWLTYPAVLLGLALGAAQGAEAGDMREGLADHAIGMGIGFGVLFAAYLFGGMGGGDVKLMAGVGALLGWPGALHAVLYSFLAAVGVGMILMVWRGQVRTVLRRFWLALRILPLPGARLSDAAPQETFRVPFGFAVAVGTAWYLMEDLVLKTSAWDAAGRLWGG